MNLSVKQAADLLGVSTHTIRVGIQLNQLPIGFCVGEGTKKTYIITEELFTKVTGVEVTK